MNLALGSGLFTTILSVLFVSAAIYGYGMLASTLTDNSASAIALFLGVLVFFAIVIMGSFTIVSEYVRSLSSVFASIVQWVSPLFYWDLATRAAEYQQWLGFAASLLVLAVLAGAVLLAGHFVLRARGVRP
jgi:hypothetical protein